MLPPSTGIFYSLHAYFRTELLLQKPVITRCNTEKSYDGPAVTETSQPEERARVLSPPFAGCTHTARALKPAKPFWQPLPKGRRTPRSREEPLRPRRPLDLKPAARQAAEGPHRGQARGAADAADRARPPPGAREPPPPQSAGRSRGARLSRSFAAGGTAGGPACPGTTYPKTPPSSRRRRRRAGRKRRPRPRLYGAGWEAGGAASHVPRRARPRPRPGWAASGGGLRRGPAADAPRAESEQEILFFWWRISSVRPGPLLTILPLFWKAGVVFPPANRSRSMAVVPGLAAAGSCRQQGPESR